MAIKQGICAILFASMLSGACIASPEEKNTGKETIQNQAVKAPLTKVQTNNSGNSTVKAPFTKVQTDTKGETRVKAPFTTVDANSSGTRTSVKAPLVKVEKDDATGMEKIRAPFVKIDRVDGKVHIRAPFVDKWKNVDTNENK